MSPVIFFGRQPVGLNEPAGIIAGRILLARATAAFLKRGHPLDGVKKGEKVKPRVFCAEAGYDVVNSEAGFFRIMIPDPNGKEGVRYVHWLGNVDEVYYQIPARHVNVDKDMICDVTNKLDNVYDPELGEYLMFKGNLWRILVQNGDNVTDYADFMNRIQDILLSRLGLNSPKRILGARFDSFIALKGGLHLILSCWPKIINLCQKHDIPGVARIPKKEEAPFYIYLQNQPRLEVQMDKLGSFVALNPITKQIVGSFSMEDLLKDVVEGRVLLTFRAVPRIILYSGIFDAQVTGGGAMYNLITRNVFQELFQIPYFPLAWMDLIDERGNRKGLFQYNSAALTPNKANLRGFREASRAIEEGAVSALDLLLSLPPDADKLVTQQVFQNLGSFTMATRINFT